MKIDTNKLDEIFLWIDWRKNKSILLVKSANFKQLLTDYGLETGF